MGSKRQIGTLAIASLGVLMALIDVTIVNVALPTLQHDLHVGFSMLQWVVNGYTIPLAVLLLTAGRLSDIYGRRLLFTIGIATFTVGSALCALTHVIAHIGLPPLGILLVGRAIQGAGSAALVPVSLAIINEAYHKDERMRSLALGVRGAMTGLGLALGPLIGGILLVHFSWTSIFYINLPVGVVTIGLAMKLIEETRDSKASKHIDLFGLFSLSVAVLALVFALILIDSNGGTITPLNIGVFVLGVAVLAVFVYGELHLRDPLYDLRLFCNRSFSGAAGSVFLLSAAILGLLFFLTLYLQNVLRLSPLGAGLALLPLTAIVMLASPLTGRYMAKAGPRGISSIGLLSAGAGIALLLLLPQSSNVPDWIVLIPGFMLIGLGMGMANPPMIAVATGTAEHEKSGLASGLNTVCRQVGTAFGVALIGAFLTIDYNGKVAHAANAASLKKAGPMLASTGQAGKTAQHAWISAFHLGLEASCILLGIGAAIAFLTIRKRDLIAERERPKREAA